MQLFFISSFLLNNDYDEMWSKSTRRRRRRTQSMTIDICNTIVCPGNRKKSEKEKSKKEE